MNDPPAIAAIFPASGLPKAFDRAVGCGEECLFVDLMQRAKQQAAEVAASVDRFWNLAFRSST